MHIFGCERTTRTTKVIMYCIQCYLKLKTLPSAPTRADSRRLADPSADFAMPPRGFKKAQAKAAAPAVSQEAAAAAGCQPGEYSVNVAHYARLQEAMNIVKTTPGMTGVETALPLEEGAVMAPLNEGSEAHAFLF